MYKAFYIPFLMVFLFFINSLAFAGSKIIDIDALESDDWIQVDTKNFSILSNGEPDKTQAIAIQLEEFRYFVSSYMGMKQMEGMPPIKLLLLDDDYDELSISRNVAGVFSATSKGFISIANGDDFNPDHESWSKHVILHEMTHYFTSNQQAEIKYPSWYLEGSADYLATMKTHKGQLSFGHLKVMKYRFRELKTRTGKCCKPIDIETLFKTPKYPEKKEVLKFYASSFAVFHYLSSSKAKRDELKKYVMLINKGVTIDEAFTEAFAMKYEQLSDAVDGYIEGNKLFARAFPISEKGFQFPPFNVTVNKLAADEAMYNLLDIALSFSNGLFVKGFSREDTLLDYADVFPKNTKGVLLNVEYGKGKSHAEKVALLEAFIPLNPKNSKAQILLGNLYLDKSQQLMRTGSKDWQKLTLKAREHYRKAIEIKEFNGEAFSQLALSYKYTAFDEKTINEAALGFEVTRLFIDSFSLHKDEAMLRTATADYTGAERSYTRLLELSKKKDRWVKSYATWVLDGLRLIQLKTIEVTEQQPNSLVFADGSHYTGAIKNDLPHGQGEVIRPSGAKYTGEWDKGLPNNEGLFIASNEMSYQGQFEQGAVHGVGTLKYGSHNIYKGEFFRFMEHGQGELIRGKKSTISGTWYKGYKHGLQTIKLKNKDPVNIEYILGKAKIVDDNGDIFIGRIDPKTHQPKGKGLCKSSTDVEFIKCKR